MRSQVVLTVLLRLTLSGSNCLHEPFGAEDADHALHVVGKNLQTDLGSDLIERFGQEVGAAHPGFERAERVLDGPPTDGHRLGAKRSSLACILSRTPSCSQRLTRLCLSVVHLELRTQASQADKLR